VAATAPALPATRFSASQARRVGRIAVETPGATVELEGRVVSVDATTRHLVLRGIEVDASAITDLVLPVVGDGVRVLGTVAADGRGVVASSVSVVHPARSTIYGFEGDAGDVVAGTAANTWTLSLLGQSLQIDADTRLVDLTLTRGRHGHGAGAASANPFNITSFQTYLAASPSKHLVVRSRDAGNGSLRALSVAIVPASSGAAVAGLVDASPAPVLSSGPGVPTTFSVHGVAVSADQAALLMRRLSLAGTQLAAGDYVLARGTLVAGTAGGAATLVVAAPANGGLRPDGRNVVVDFGPLSDRDRDRDCF
jgi:hypothetical protein